MGHETFVSAGFFIILKPSCHQFSSCHQFHFLRYSLMITTAVYGEWST